MTGSEEKVPGTIRIARERRRQIEEERFTPGHDTAHTDASLAMAAACLAAPERIYVHERHRSNRYRHLFADAWPSGWSPGWDKRWPNGRPEVPGDHIPDLTSARRVDNLVKAGALIAAEIDRLLGLSAEDVLGSSREAAPPDPDTCPRCRRAYRFEEERENRLCAVCVDELWGRRKKPDPPPPPHVGVCQAPLTVTDKPVSAQYQTADDPDPLVIPVPIRDCECVACGLDLCEWDRGQVYMLTSRPWRRVSCWTGCEIDLHITYPGARFNSLAGAEEDS